MCFFSFKKNAAVPLVGF